MTENTIKSDKFNAILYRSNDMESSYNDKIEAIQLGFKFIKIQYKIDSTLENSLYQLISCKKVYVEILNDSGDIIFRVTSNIIFKDYNIDMSYNIDGSMTLTILYLFE